MGGGSYFFDSHGVLRAEDMGMQKYHDLEKAGLSLWDF
jgi:hypothetical protein